MIVPEREWFVRSKLCYAGLPRSKISYRSYEIFGPKGSFDGAKSADVTIVARQTEMLASDRTEEGRDGRSYRIDDLVRPTVDRSPPRRFKRGQVIFTFGAFNSTTMLVIIGAMPLL